MHRRDWAFTERDCEWCGRSYLPTATAQKFCSSACRTRFREIDKRILASEPPRDSEEYEAELSGSIQRLQEAWRCR